MPVLLALAWLLMAAPAMAQPLAPAPPGPYVIDVRGVTSALPGQALVLPSTTQRSAVPTRGLGLEAAVHVLRGRLGPARLGWGAAIMRAAATSTSGVQLSAITVAPQVSFNFGTRDGWSYLSAGGGPSRFRASGPTLDARSSGVPTINVGGGARWFVRPHVAVGFDLRFHRAFARDAYASSSLFAAAAGLSIR